MNIKERPSEIAPSVTILNRCVVCGDDDLREVLDLGAQPLANSLHDGSGILPAFPLKYKVCQSCWHGQLSVAVDPHIMFDSYLYVSGTTRTLRGYFQDFVSKVERDLAGDGRKKLKVLEIGSNDGSLLAEFAHGGHDTLGIEPAANIANN